MEKFFKNTFLGQRLGQPFPWTPIERNTVKLVDNE